MATSESTKSFRVIAIITAYNEADIITQTIEALLREEIEVYLVDDGSTDDTVRRASQFIGRGLIDIEQSSSGPTSERTFRWRALLEHKERLARELSADWFIHHDADEFRESPWAGVPLRRAIAHVDRLGYNAVDFKLLDFFPTDECLPFDGDVRRSITRYRPAQSWNDVQVKCWKKTEHAIDLASSGGHEAKFPGRRIFPIRFLLRHYPIRGQAHGSRKVFVDRLPRFSAEDRARGWHVHYDHLRPSERFVADPADLTLYDPEAVRVELTLRHRDPVLHADASPDATGFLEVWERERAALTNEINQLTASLETAEQRISEVTNQLLLSRSDLETLTTRQHHSAEMLSIARRELEVIQATLSWRMARSLWQVTGRMAPAGTRRERFLKAVIATAHGLAGLERQQAVRHARSAVEPGPFVPPLIVPRRSAERREETVDIVICVHNALSDLQACVDSLIQHTAKPYRLILIDDGSDAATHAYLDRIAEQHRGILIRNAPALGYTKAANQGLRASSAPYVVLLNSDTVVTDGWLDRLVNCAKSQSNIGLVGPLSNAASWQSVPTIERPGGGDWSDNPLPAGVNGAAFASLIAADSAQLYPRVGFLNGFCLLVTRSIIDRIGVFDEQTFGAGYGEENDFCLRASAAGFTLAIADDSYVYHSQSRSYSHARRRELDADAQKRLRLKHEPSLIEHRVAATRDDRCLAGVRAHASNLAAREACREEGRKRWAGAKVAFLLPVAALGGGAKVVLQEARAMQSMHVDVRIVNLIEHREYCGRACADFDVPVTYISSVADIPRACAGADAVVATANTTVEWLVDLPTSIRRGYYIQDYEPLFYLEGSPEHARAVASYARFPNLVRVTKTAWNRAAVQSNTGVTAVVVGPSVDMDVCRPRPRRDGDWPDRPLRIAAMIRPSSPQRRAKETLEALELFTVRYEPPCEIITFGCDASDPSFGMLPWQPHYRHAGRLLDRFSAAALLNEVDIFVDFSSYQAMGLTALEAMACGVAVIVPEAGGATTFAEDEINALVVDTTAQGASLAALTRLASDADLRRRLQRTAIQDAAGYFPERPASRILGELLG